MEKPNTQAVKLAQSASAIGAAILGFGIGAQWGTPVKTYAFAILAMGAFIHLYGMYVTQMKENAQRTNTLSKVLWFSAWLCLLALIVLFVYMSIIKK